MAERFADGIALVLCGFGASELGWHVASKDMKVIDLGVEDIASRRFGQRNAVALRITQLEACGVIENSDIYSALVGTVKMDEAVGIMRHLAAKRCEAVGIFDLVEANDSRMVGISYDASDLFGFVVETGVGPTP